MKVPFKLAIVARAHIATVAAKPGASAGVNDAVVIAALGLAETAGRCPATAGEQARNGNQ
jgi:hypothetical protein